MADTNDRLWAGVILGGTIGYLLFRRGRSNNIPPTPGGQGATLEQIASLNPCWGKRLALVQSNSGAVTASRTVPSYLEI